MPTRRVRTVASVVAVGLAVSSMVAFAVLSDGNATRKVDLNDSGVWVTSNDDGMFGRVNKTAGALDALVNAGGLASTYDLDVMQDRSAIVARNVAGGQLLPVSSAAGIALKDQAVDVPPGMVVDMRGGTIAVLDPPTGNLWATRYDSTQTVTTLTALASTAKPLASLGAAPKDDPGAASYAALAVGTDGTVHAISRTGKTATIVPDGPMSLGKPVLGTVAGSLKSVRMSAVGSTPVILDAVALGLAREAAAMPAPAGAETSGQSASGAVVLGRISHALVEEPGEALTVRPGAEVDIEHDQVGPALGHQGQRLASVGGGNRGRSGLRRGQKRKPLLPEHQHLGPQPPFFPQRPARGRFRQYSLNQTASKLPPRELG